MKREALRADNVQLNMVEKYSQMVYRLAFSMMKNKYDADDIHQEVFVRFLKKQPRFAGCRQYREDYGACQGRKPKTAAVGRKVLQPVLTTLIFMCILSAVSLPVLAAHVPAVYRMLERYVPDMADYIVPEEPECADQGIIMRVEGIQLEGNHAEIVVSFSNQEGYHYIKGKVDMYDNYGLVSYKGVGTIGGCFFLAYDEVEEKAYFRIDMTADQDFDREKLSFHVGELLTTMGREEKNVDLSEILYDAPMKKVESRGGGGDIQSVYEEEAPMGYVQVLDGLPVMECAADDFTLTGIAYKDGVLRVQMCMGDNTHADRHVQLFLTGAEGNERYGHESVSWFEDVEETRYTFYEYGFLIEEKELENAEMYGIFYNAEESVKGDWTVTFRLK